MSSRFNELMYGNTATLRALVDHYELTEIDVRAVLLNLINRVESLESAYRSLMRPTDQQEATP